MGLTMAEALKIHTERMKIPVFRADYIEKCTSDVRICNATGRYSVVDLAVLFDLSSQDVVGILRGCG